MVINQFEIMEYKFLLFRNSDILILKNESFFKYYENVNFENGDCLELWAHRFFVKFTLE